MKHSGPIGTRMWFIGEDAIRTGFNITPKPIK